MKTTRAETAPAQVRAGMAHTKHKHEIVDHQQFFDFEGFMRNGLQIRNQRIFLHRIAPVNKI